MDDQLKGLLVASRDQAYHLLGQAKASGSDVKPTLAHIANLTKQIGDDYDVETGTTRPPRVPIVARRYVAESNEVGKTTVHLKPVEDVREARFHTYNAELMKWADGLPAVGDMLVSSTGQHFYVRINPDQPRPAAPEPPYNSFQTTEVGFGDGGPVLTVTYYAPGEPRPGSMLDKWSKAAARGATWEVVPCDGIVYLFERVPAGVVRPSPTAAVNALLAAAWKAKKEREATKPSIISFTVFQTHLEPGPDGATARAVFKPPSPHSAMEVVKLVPEARGWVEQSKKGDVYHLGRNVVVRVKD